ncbi:MAG: hypothetical protein MRY83_12085, partial [Flavobacteriales bacterium]|nr:hypothetical protein [Flavobacteriales bacterium]
DSPTEVLDIVGAAHLTPQASPPASADEGDLYSDTDNNLYYYNGSSWEDLTSNGSGDNLGDHLALANIQLNDGLGLTDDDEDTKIQLEETDDEDAIRFDLGGAENFVMEKNSNNVVRLEILNSNTSFGIGDDALSSDDGTANDNIGIGQGALTAATSSWANIAIGNQSLNTISAATAITGYQNIAVGHSALRANTTGRFNVTLGSFNGFLLTTGEQNTAIGAQSMFQMQTGSDNVGVGFQSCGGSSASPGSGSANVAIGDESLTSITSGSQNVTVGQRSGESLTTGSGNVFLGRLSGANETGSNKLYIENSNANASNALIYGEFDNDMLRINGDLELNSNNLSFDDGGGITDADEDTKIQLEETDDDDVIRFDLGGTEYFVMDGGHFEINNTGESVFYGKDAGAVDDGTANQNVFLGTESGMSNTSGFWNVAIGHEAFRANTNGFNNVAIGWQSQLNASGAQNNTSIGFASMTQNTSGGGNSAIGKEALYSNSTASFNTGLGGEVLRSNQTGGFNTAMGHGAARTLNGGANNVAIGFEAGYSNVTGNSNVFIGNQAGYNETTSNKLYIENSNSSSPLIYGDFSNDIVRINDSLQIGAQGKFDNGYAFPSIRGANNEVLAVTGDGLTEWTAIDGLLLECPTGFTAVTASGRILGCIETDESDYDGDGIRNEVDDETSTRNAMNYCFTTFGGRLPSAQEMIIAKDNLALTNESDDSEPTGDFVSSSQVIVVNTNPATSVNWSSARAFRCWIEK